SGQRLSSAQGRRAPGPSMEQTLAQGHGVCATAGATRSLAHRFFLRQCRGNLLLPVQHPGGVFALDRALGNSGSDEGSRCRTGAATGPGEVPPSSTADHLGQRPAVRGEGLQRVSSPVADEARIDQPALPAEQRQVGALPSDVEGTGHSAQDSTNAGGCSTGSRRICRALQHGAIAQRLGLRDAPGSAGGPTHRDLCHARSQAGSSARSASAAPCQPGVFVVNNAVLATGHSRLKLNAVHPEGRALLGSNPSAAVNSNTAGLGGFGHPGRPPAGSIAKRKIPGVRGQSPRVVPQSNQKETRGKSALAFSTDRRFTLNQYMPASVSPYGRGSLRLPDKAQRQEYVAWPS